MPIHDRESRSCLKLFIWQLSSFITDSMGMSSSKLLELVMGREAGRAAVHGVTKSWTRLSKQTELKRTEQILKNLKIQFLLTPCTFLFLSVFSLPGTTYDKSQQFLSAKQHWKGCWKKINQIVIWDTCFWLQVMCSSSTRVWELPCGSDGKACAGGLSSIVESGRSPGEGSGYPL